MKFAAYCWDGLAKILLPLVIIGDTQLTLLSFHSYIDCAKLDPRICWFILRLYRRSVADLSPHQWTDPLRPRFTAPRLPWLLTEVNMPYFQWTCHWASRGRHHKSLIEPLVFRGRHSLTPQYNVCFIGIAVRAVHYSFRETYCLKRVHCNNNSFMCEFCRWKSALCTTRSTI